MSKLSETINKEIKKNSRCMEYLSFTDGSNYAIANAILLLAKVVNNTKEEIEERRNVRERR